MEVDDGKLKWISYEDLLDLVISIPENDELLPVFLLTFWTFTTPEKLLADLKNRFQNSKNKEAKKNILGLLYQWIDLDSSAFELDRILWTDSLAPFLSNLVQKDKKWKSTANKIASRFLGTLSFPIFKQWKFVLCSFKFEQNSFFSILPRDVILLILSFSSDLTPWPKSKFDLNNHTKKIEPVVGEEKKKKKKESEKLKKSDALKKSQKLKKSNLTLSQNLLIDLDISVFSEQLTLFEYEIFSRIRPHEIFCHIWKKKNYSLNVMLLVEHFEKLSSWIILNIVTCENIEKRIEVISKFILILENLYFLKNYSGCMEVIAALSSSCVSRLKHTWNGVPKKILKKFNELISIFEPTMNYKQLREMMKNAQSKVSIVPYFGLTLQDLSFVVEGIPSFNSEEKINWHKNDLIYQALLDCYILIPYENIVKIDWIGEKFRSLHCPPKDVTFDWSLYIEPRQGAARIEKPTYVFEPF